eukprot:COSAG05_NODE_2651_length_2801_cov_28.578090_4_plen_152_part_01
MISNASQDPAKANLALEASAAGQLKIDGRVVRLDMADRGSASTNTNGNSNAAATKDTEDIVGWQLPMDEMGGEAGGSTAAQLPPPPACAVSYLCRLPSARGRFNAAAAIALGVPKGKAFGDVVLGGEVIGRCIYSPSWAPLMLRRQYGASPL